MDDQNPPTSNTAEIVNLLKQYSNEGLKFEEAKQKLRAQGYSDLDINEATDDYQYGEQQVSDIPQKVTDYYKLHPDQALTDGANLLRAARKEEATQDRTQAVLDISASQAASELGVGNIDAQTEYLSKFSKDVGVSFWLILAAGIIIDGGAMYLVYLLKLNLIFYYIIGGVVSIAFIAFLIYRIKD